MIARVVFGLLLSGFGAVRAAGALDATLAKMDAAAAKFKGMSTNVKRVSHTAVINEDSTDSGIMRMKRSKQDTLMIVDLTAPDHKTVALQGDTVQIYLPKIQTVQEYNVGKNRSLLEQFLLLGFGSSGKELASAYAIKDAGAENVGGEPSEHLQLTPKSPEVAKQLKTIDLWIADKTGYPVQQKFNQPSGDYMLVTFTGMKVNPDLPDSSLKLKLPKGVKKEYPQR